MVKTKRDGFYKRGRFWWASSDPITKKPESTKCTSIEAARAWYREREIMAHDPSYVSAKNATLGEWCDKYLALKATKSEATRKAEDSKIRAVLGVLPRETPLRTIDAGTFDEYIINRRAQYNQQKRKAPGDYTIRRELAKLACVLRLAKRGKCYTGDLDALIPETLEGTYTPRQRSLTEHELVALFAVLPNDKWRALVFVCVGIGCRLSEACKLTRRDVDLDAMLVRIRGTKTEGSDRELPVLKVYRAMVERALPHLPIGKISNIDRTFKTAARKASIDRFSPNDLRRTHSTLLGERGIHDDVIARLLGHTTVALTKRTYNRAKARELQKLTEEQLSSSKPIAILADGLQIDDSNSNKVSKHRGN